MLNAREQLVGFTFRQLKPYERNYLPYDLELAAMILHEKYEVITCIWSTLEHLY